MANYRYEEERTRGQRGMSRRGGWGERGRYDDDEQYESERFSGGQHYGRDYGAQGGRYGGGYEGGGRSQGQYGGSLGGRQQYGGYEDDENYGSSSGESGEYGASGSERGQGRGWGSQRAWQGYQSGGYQRGYQGGGNPGGEYQGGGGYQGGGYQGGGNQGGGNQGGGYQGGGYQGGGYQGGGYQGGGYQAGGYGQSGWQGQGSYGAGQRGWQGGTGGSMQADGWTREPDEMRWGRQQGLYGSSEIGGALSSHRSQRDYQSHIGKGPKGWQRSDERLREEVSEALARHPDIDASEIEVRVQNGEVTLTGSVQERKAKRMAEDVAEDVFGVKDVQNQIKVTGGLMNKLFGDKDVTTGAEREGRTGKDREGEETTSRRSTASSTTSR
ncbi:MAG TPA: BON domain-containing protein [Gemmatimonadaceae bacterium]